MGDRKAAESAMLGSREAPLLYCTGEGEGWEPQFGETHAQAVGGFID